MLVILEAISGPVIGRRIEVHGGTILRIGRIGKSDYAIAEDGYLSGVHFSVECDGAQCRIRDLGSSNGTFVNGARIAEQVVRDGDSVVAGGSTFRVHIDEMPSITGVGLPRVGAATPPIAVAAQTLAGTGHVTPWQSGYTSAETALLATLYGSGEKVFAILDASRDSRIRAFLESSGEKHFSLDSSGVPVAYVAALPPESRLVHVLIKDGWGQGWGFYGTTRTDLEDVRAHFAKLVRLRTDSGQAITFRFWDPRVIRALVPAMPPPESNAFFGPCERIVVEAEEARTGQPVMALEFLPSERGPRQQTVVVG